MNMMKGKIKRIVAGVLSAMTIVGVIPAQTFAAGGSANITFAYMYQSNGSQILYQDSFMGTHGSDGGPGQAMTQIYANGEEAYCIEPGAPLHTGDTLTANASDVIIPGN